jgi:hypothetical protein
MQSCCSAVCAIQYAKDNPKLVKKVERDSFNSWKKEVKEKHRTHGSYENELQPLINKIVRLIDYGNPCISCYRPIAHKKHDAGHYHSVQSNNSIRFNLLQEFSQCTQCNDNKGSNRSGYDKGLKETFGFDFWLYVNEGIVRDYPFVKLSIPELKEAIQIAKQVVKELESDKTTRTAEERLSERKKINQLIGIYTK